MLMTKSDSKAKTQSPSEHDLLLAILSKLDELVKISENTRDERFNSQVYVMAAGSIQVIEEATVPKYWAVYVSGVSAASAAVRVYREKLTSTSIPAQGVEVVVLTNGEGFRLPGRSPSITIANTGAASATVIVSAVGDANFGKL